MNTANANVSIFRTARNLLSGLLTTAVLSLAAAPALAHSVGACANAIVESCNAQWPDNYPARIACVNSGLNFCETHKHSGGGNNAVIDPTLSARNRVGKVQTAPIFKSQNQGDKVQMPVLIRR